MLVDSQLVGVIATQVKESRKLEESPAAMIALFIDPDHQRKGIGIWLVSEVE